MTIDGKLVIGILTNKKETSLCVLKAMAEMEMVNGHVGLYTDRGLLYTDDSIYKIINPEKYKGNRVDQLIISYVFCDDIVNYLLTESCVPYDCQLIDIEDVL